MMMDESKTVSELSAEIGKKLGIKDPEEFSLQREGDLDCHWLNPRESLPEQGVDSLVTLVLRKKYFFQDYTAPDARDETLLNSLFCQGLDAIVGGTNPCTLEEAIKMAGIQCQIRFGDFNENSNMFESLKWSDYLPIEYAQQYSKKIEKEVLNEYKKLTGLNEISAKIYYLRHAKFIKTFGYTFFKVINNSSNKEVLLGISKTNIMLLEPSSKNTISLSPLNLLIQWKVFQDNLTLYYLDTTEDFTTKESKDIALIISDYASSTLNTSTSTSTSSPTCTSIVVSPLSISSIISSNKVKDRIKQISLMMGKSIGSKSSEELTLVINPNVKKSPIYVNPNNFYRNPVYPSSLFNFNLDSDERNYCMKMIRSLSCLKNSLSVQVKEREIKVKLPDKNIKSIIVNSTKTVYDISLEIAEQLGIKNGDEFSLQREDNENWLNPYQALREQNILDNDISLFIKKFYYNDAFVTNTDPVYFNLLFCQLQEAITTGIYPCNINEAVQLAATQFQINFGDHNPNIHKPGFLQLKDLKFFLPVECLEFWGVTFQKLEKSIYREHQKLRGIKEEYAKYRYLQLCRNLRAYGTVCFQVKLLTAKGKANNLNLLPSTGFLLGFSRDSLRFLTLKTKNVLIEYPLTQLRKWEATPNTFIANFGDYPQGILTFKTNEGEFISKYLSDYLDFIQKTRMATQTFNVEICKYPPTEDNFFISETNTVCCWENGKRVFTSSFDTM